VFDVGFSELVLIALIALLVLGPERLPPLIRTTGRWIGRAQRLVRELKTQLENETGARDFNQFRQNLQREDLGLTQEPKPGGSGDSASDKS
jgi:sec-independent protein translocase protein TatB